VKHLDATFFGDPQAFRAWLERNGAQEQELWVGYWKKSTGRVGVTYPQSVDEALCFGWIDGLTRSIDAERYATRFTPRRAGSIWSTVNIRRVAELIAAGRMTDAGMAAFEARRADRTGVYAGDMERVEFPPDLEARFRNDEAAWAFWLQQPPGYRRQMTWWVVSAKRDDTRQRRMDALIEEHRAGRRINRQHLPKLKPRRSDA
jgi:uncharacterized protein YdeI (YjbR/CyaY-like superfamily)